MFDNPEKLFIILLIALFIFGPQKLIGLGGAMGRAIRDFRGAVRDAQEQISAAAEEVHKAEDMYKTSEPASLPAPDVTPAIAGGDAAATAPPYSASTIPASAVEDHEGPHSLTSEPSAQAVLEALQPKGQP